MKYYKQQGYGAIAILLDDSSLEVYTLDGFKFTSPQWYSKEFFPMLEEISREDFEDERENILKYSSLNKNKDEFKIIDIDRLQVPTLYHGTDKKMLRMTEDERNTYKSLCLQVIDYFYPIFKSHFYHDPAWNLEQIGLDAITTSKLYDVIGCIRSFKNEAPRFQYPDNIIYLSSMEHCAYGYAKDSFAGGEIGANAFYLCLAATHAFKHNMVFDKDIETAVKKILEFGNREKEPIVIPFDNLKVEYLRDEAGYLLTLFDFSNLSFRYLAPLHFEIQYSL